MTIQVDNALPPNVVEIGNEITQGVVDGLMSANPSPSSANPYLTVNKAATTYLPLTGGTLVANSTISVQTVPDIDNQGNKAIFKPEGLKAIFYSGGGSEETNYTIYGSDGIGYVNLNPDYDFGLSTAYVFGTNDGTTWGISTSGVTFPDATIQTTAAVSPNLTGYLTKADNLASVASASAARTNLGLGSSATNASTVFAQVTNNLSDVTASTARTNLGLTTVATASFATDAQVIAGTSASTVVAPSSAKSLRYTSNGNEIDLTPYAWLSSFTVWAGTRNRLNFPINGNASLLVGQGSWSIENQFAAIGAAQVGIDWTKRISLVGRFALSQTSPTTNNIFRYTLGKVNSTTFGDLATPGIGVRCLYGSALEIQCRNASGITNFTTSFTPTFNNTLFEVRVDSDGAGNVTCFVNGTQVGTTTGGPTVASTTTQYYTTFELVSASVNTNAPTAAGSAFKINYGY